MVLDLVDHLLLEIWDLIIMVEVACTQIMDAKGAAA
jgi:hypothetical protein